jgi:hypothetical protein
MDAPTTCPATTQAASNRRHSNRRHSNRHFLRSNSKNISLRRPSNKPGWSHNRLPLGSASSTYCSFKCTDVLRNRSNNPFAAASSPAPPPVPSPQQPAQSPLSNFSLPSTYESHTPPPRQHYSPSPRPAPAPSPSPQSTPLRGPTRTDQEHAHLANLFAARDGDGVDTFGNIGTLRYAVLSYYISGRPWVTDAMSLSSQLRPDRARKARRTKDRCATTTEQLQSVRSTAAATAAGAEPRAAFLHCLRIASLL